MEGMVEAIGEAGPAAEMMVAATGAEVAMAMVRLAGTRGADAKVVVTRVAVAWVAALRVQVVGWVEVAMVADLDVEAVQEAAKVASRAAVAAALQEVEARVEVSQVGKVGMVEVVTAALRGEARV